MSIKRAVIALIGTAVLLGLCLTSQEVWAVCTDLDGDGFGDPASEDCTYPQWDCNDGDEEVNPLAVEGYYADLDCNDGVDNDCNGGPDGAGGTCITLTCQEAVNAFLSPDCQAQLAAVIEEVKDCAEVYGDPCYTNLALAAPDCVPEIIYVMDLNYVAEEHGLCGPSDDGGVGECVSNCHDHDFDNECMKIPSIPTGQECLDRWNSCLPVCFPSYPPSAHIAFRHGAEAARVSGLLNQFALVCIPLGVIILIRILRKRRC